MTATPSPYFCYWQQDDICSTDYLARLYEHAEAHPFSACAYSDVQWFGSRVDRDILASVTGLSTHRVLHMMEASSFVPFRGVIRTAAMQRAGPLRVNEFNSTMEDLVWVAKLAREGELHRVEGPLYYKRRSHLPERHATWHCWPPERRREAWIVFGLGFVEALWDAFPLAEKPILLCQIAERLSLAADHRWLYYDPSEREGDSPDKLARDFFAASVEWAENRFGESDGFAFASAAGAAGLSNLERACCHALGRKSVCASLRTQLVQDGELEVEVAAGQPGASLLGEGWSHPEIGHIWSEAAVATIDLSSIAPSEEILLTLRGRPYKPSADVDSPWRVEIIAGSDIRFCEVLGGKWETEISLPVDVRSVDLRFLDAASPISSGEGEDPRRLALALTAIGLRLGSHQNTTPAMECPKNPAGGGWRAAQRARSR
jgi:hypothetical protein